MSPSELNEYLTVMRNNKVSAGIVQFPNGITLQMTFMPDPNDFVGTTPTAGGWKSPSHLDNPDALRADGDHVGELP